MWRSQNFQLKLLHFRQIDQWSGSKQCGAHCTLHRGSLQRAKSRESFGIRNLLRQKQRIILIYCGNAHHQYMYQPTNWWASWLTAPITHLRQFKWICDQCKYIFHTNLLTKKVIIQIILNNDNNILGGSIFHEQLLTKNSDNSSATNAQINLNKKSYRLRIIQTIQLQAM